MVTVIDAPCGVGKTHYIIEEMNANPDTSYLYIAPLREIFDRLDGKDKYKGQGTNEVYFTPVNYTTEWNGETIVSDGTKLSSIKSAMESGTNIKSTHALFLSFDDECCELAQSRNYHLVIDEDLNAVTVLSESKDNDGDDNAFSEDGVSLSYGDICFLVNNHAVTIDKNNYGQVIWIDNTAERHKYEAAKRLIQTGAVSCINDSFIVWQFPVKILQSFEDVTILTYRFNYSILKAYLDFWQVPYIHRSLERVGNGHILVPHSPEHDKGWRYKGLIRILRDEKSNAIGKKSPTAKHTPLSWSWYKSSMDAAKRKTLSDKTYNFFHNTLKVDRDNVMWTTYKKWEDLIRSDYKYRRTKKLDEHGNPTKEKQTTFVQCGCRATEHHDNCTALAYLINRYLNPGITNFLAQRDITINQDEWALSEMLQWIFRSAVRHDNPIDIYVPSFRMRSLLDGWLTP